ncbi:hypothetical protein SEA_SHARKBOY_19 [Microbacterium phage Sharkboy]|uniref:Uncharacterized protein n=1 Tax=Microbacterium phage Sharkboy TaxID=2590938 RepID=A0A516KU80_9CAUD|nr:hypothetical protein SEA_SHARKBOY_19 [Microbacterium phage Sharkboy]WNM67340.1 minor tail protein [Microbacterium phage ChiliPepper]
MVSSNFPNRPFRLEEWVTIYQQRAWNAGNDSLVHSELWIRKNSYSPTWSGSGSSFSMFINGAQVGGNGNFGYDFRNSDQMLLHASDNWFGHDGNGNMWVQIDGYANVVTMGYTEVHSGFWAPRIGRPPNAPGNLRLEPGSLKTDAFGVRYDRGGENGAAITNDYAEWALDSGFTQIVWTDGSGPGTGPNGYTNPRGNGNGPGPQLIPGRTYYVRIQSDAYGIGRSGYSPTFSLKTLAALYASNGSSWLPVEIYVSNGTSWRPVEVLYSKSGVWTTPSTI